MVAATDVINILVVDDSVFVRKVVSGFFAGDERIKIAAEAKNGRDALDKVKLTKFDLVLTDFEMPEMNGEEFLLALRSESSITEKPPVMVFSSFTSAGSKATVACLLAGARDYIQKPSRDLNDLSEGVSTKEILRKKIIEIVESERSRRMKFQQPRVTKTVVDKVVTLRNPGIVVIGSSTGGPSALEKVLMDIPASFRLPILIVQHMPEHFTKIMAESLTKKVPLNVIEVTSETKIEPGNIYLCGGGEHMVLDEKGFLQTAGKEPRNFCVPSVNVLFESVAKHYKKGVISVMLTGMGSDGKDGVQALKDSLHCFSIVQDEATAVVWSMPRAVHEAGCSDVVLPLDEIGRVIANV